MGNEVTAGLEWFSSLGLKTFYLGNLEEKTDLEGENHD